MLPSGLPVTAELGWIASGTGDVGERARAALERLRRVVPFEGGWVGLLDPQRGGHILLASQGYDGPVRERLAGPAVAAEVEHVGLSRWPRLAMRIADLPYRPAESGTWEAYMRPAGFRDGLGVGLFSRDGRYLGVFGLSTDTAGGFTEAVRDAVGLLAPAIADAVDPLRPIASAARLVHGATAGVVLTRAGAAQPLPGLPDHPLLAAGSTVLAVAAAQLAGALQYATFLCPSGPADHLRVTALAGPAWPPTAVTAAVVVGPPGDLSGLTRRELEILGLLVEGWANRRIAAGLGIADRTVAAHLEHVLAKLGAQSRTLAAVRAQRQGLYVPRGLA
ncbi:LuxR C-terminal-related transcriptional regulator [Phytohabitans rumicis]|nr:LuxR C-terminal-related transcriptional regulator [Phytohabitans rumicis]